MNETYMMNEDEYQNREEMKKLMILLNKEELHPKKVKTYQCPIPEVISS